MGTLLTWLYAKDPFRGSTDLYSQERNPEGGKVPSASNEEKRTFQEGLLVLDRKPSLGEIRPVPTGNCSYSVWEKRAEGR